MSARDPHAATALGLFEEGTPERTLYDAARRVVDLSRPGWPNEFWYGVREREMRKLIDAMKEIGDVE